jgi:hypothetical protein
VLVSLQGLVLNEKPYFNEAGYEKQVGTVEGEKNALPYNENTYLLSVRSMLYILRRPPMVIHPSLLVTSSLVSYCHYVVNSTNEQRLFSEHHVYPFYFSVMSQHACILDHYIFFMIIKRTMMTQRY